MNRLYILSIVCIFLLSSCKVQKAVVSPGYNQDMQELKSYQIYDKHGNPVTYAAMMKDVSTKKIVFFGEEHNNVISHWLQMEVYHTLNEASEVVIGMEMMERDQQDILDEYMKGHIDYTELEAATRLWNNFETDYLPIINAAKANNQSVIATNIPRRYANKVFKGGFESLDALPLAEKKWIAPLPIPYDPTLSRYVAMVEMMGDHGGERLPMAQATKDATMARSIVDNLLKEGYFLHLNGSYHSDYSEGILWYLRQYGFTGEKAIISTTTQESIHDFPGELKGISDYLIVVTPRMPRSY